MVRVLFALVAALGAGMCMYVNFGSAALLNATGACVVLSQKHGAAVPELIGFCKNLSDMNWVWNPVSYMGSLGILFGITGFFLAGSYAKK